jgi:uncharacterized protein (TIGR00251 family)
LLNIAESIGSISFPIRVIPRSSKTEVAGEHDGALRIRLKSPPVDGAANEELIRFLSKSFDIPKTSVEIISGQASRTKRVRLSGVKPDDIGRFLQGKI